MMPLSRRLPITIVLAIPLLFGAALGSERDAVAIIHIPRTATTRGYDSKNPSASLPATLPDEVGVTVSEFGCTARVLGSVVEEAHHIRNADATVRVDAVEITLDLRVTEWIEQNAGPKILAHENGHRMIAEHFYEHADAPARAIGQTMIGRRFSATGADVSATAKAALDNVATEIAQKYMLAVRDPSEQVQEQYDRITRHGSNSIDELAAIDQALRMQAQDEEAINKQSTKGK